MDRRLEQSSNVRSVGYDGPCKTLQLEFHRGGLYHHPGVPEAIYQDFMRAASKGSCFHGHIKRRYPDRQVR